jgi:hypothetical protein
MQRLWAEEEALGVGELMFVPPSEPIVALAEQADPAVTGPDDLL